MEPSDLEPGSSQGPKTALNALLNLCFNKLQCKPGRTRDLRDSKAGSVAVSQLLLTHLENALNARLPSRSTKVQRKQAPTRKPQSSHSGSICQRLERKPSFTAHRLAPPPAGASAAPRDGRYGEMLVQFDDRPENYRSWRSTFQGMTRSLDLNANEELDLLVKWLGVESSGYAKRLRSVHVANPEPGLRLVWERLEGCYGRPEVIEDALFKRVANFPRLSDKDTHKLRELGELLLELECAKADPHLTGLSYLDTARGISPIVEKLPPRLQEAWISKASRYKQNRGVAFPPFTLFAEFVRGQAKMRNDPSFTLTSANGAVSNHEGNRKAPISAHVTDVELSSETSPAACKKVTSSTKYCPLHKKPHPLQKCRAFREKPLDERKSLLKQFGLCFKCCTATDHFGKDCKVVVTCGDCGSIKHATALHQGSLSSVASDSKQVAKIDEPNSELQSPKVSSTCTEVCGRGCAGSRSTSPSDLADFLLAYRNTPQATTAEAPSVLLLGRRLRTRLDLVRPSVNDTVAHKQFREASRHRRRESTFREGDLVRVRNFRRGPRRFSATVLARTGPVSYRVSVVTPRGVCEWVRHRNHVVRALDSDDLVINDADFRADAPVTVNTSPTSTTELAEQPSAANQAAEQGRRYPQRQRRAPDRYGT
ncbi:hypothetical protein MTO96_052352 [Rhipicephalus appendiculatus]